jgi:predicted nucleic acid-binding protein
MKQVFADTVFFLALLNPSDELHPNATRLNEHAPGPMLTTEFILIEVGDALSHPNNRPRFSHLLDLLRQQRDVEIIEATSTLFRQGCQLYAERDDKEWSLTDCTSFVVMQQRHLQDALTSDHHFEQAGFTILMKK